MIESAFSSIISIFQVLVKPSSFAPIDALLPPLSALPCQNRRDPRAAMAYRYYSYDV
jgi:hypothetical protein